MKVLNDREQRVRDPKSTKNNPEPRPTDGIIGLDQVNKAPCRTHTLHTHHTHTHHHTLYTTNTTNTPHTLHTLHTTHYTHTITLHTHHHTLHTTPSHTTHTLQTHHHTTHNTITHYTHYTHTTHNTHTLHTHHHTLHTTHTTHHHTLHTYTTHTTHTHHHTLHTTHTIHNTHHHTLHTLHTITHYTHTPHTIIHYTHYTHHHTQHTHYTHYIHTHHTLHTHTTHTTYTLYTTHTLHTHYTHYIHTTHTLHTPAREHTTYTTYTHYTHNAHTTHTTYTHCTHTTHTLHTLHTHYTHYTHYYTHYTHTTHTLHTHYTHTTHTHYTHCTHYTHTTHTLHTPAREHTTHTLHTDYTHYTHYTTHTTHTLHTLHTHTTHTHYTHTTHTLHTLHTHYTHYTHTLHTHYTHTTHTTHTHHTPAREHSDRCSPSLALCSAPLLLTATNGRPKHWPRSAVNGWHLQGLMENLLDIGESEEMQETAARTPVAEQSPDVPSEAAPCDRDACDGGARQRDGEIRSQEDAATPCRSCGRPSEWHLHVAAGGRPERTWFCCEALWETVREAWGHEVPAPWHAEDAEGPNSAVLVQERRDRIVARILERQDELHRTVSFALPAPRCPPAHPTEPHSSARQPGAQPHARGPLIPGGVCAQRGEVVERFYEGGRKFSTFFADGTGHVLDPAGRVVLQAARGPGGRLVWVAWAQGGRVLAVLGAAGGGAVCVSASGGVRLVVTPSGGRCYGAGGWETRRWLWEDAAACGHHVHAPPLQPVDVPLGARAPRVRLLTREDAVLTYVARNRSVRLRVAYQPHPSRGGGA
ncbi:uncharacterized protein LOC116954553 isoform X2 [Petromyzon marinus]|uniref:uncharacterized protein LOC116954553 isoform X2 n=1 Tax=Petromyzon marinus TaxID=7757 RepID=UPI003F7283DB